MIMIRVVTVILFSAYTLWAQVPQENREQFAETAAAAKPFSLFGAKGNYPTFPQYSSRLTLKLDLPHYGPSELKIFQLAENSKPLFSFNPQTTTPNRKSVGFSKGFSTRRKIHKYASIATLPLLVAESIVGQKLLDGDRSDSLRSAHSGLAAGMGVLFGVETVTGVWNMMEARKYPGNKKRLFHGILMLAADAGFFATAVTAPGDDDDDDERGHGASTHKALAYATIGSAAFSYIYMLIAK